ncbi:MAG: hypothetical protein HYU76_07455 [Betaproteobacteria bacterium]|nr:hypothetical protein [Betaproteobacteria bacterium]
MKKPFTVLAAIIFALVAAVHLLRLVYGWEVTVNRAVVPMWASILGLMIAGGLAVMLWLESRE